MRATFTIPGEVVPKGRPKFSHVGNYVKAYTPAKTVNFENLVKIEYERQCPDTFFPEGKPLAMYIEFHFKIPQSASNKKKALMASNEIRPTRKPDLDNAIKSVADGLNGVAYKDDSQIVKISCTKWYGDIPHTKVLIVSED